MGTGMASSPELFVVCKNCQSQVSPYVTECPYCGTRLRKRAPKIEREPKTPRRRMPTPSLGPLRSGEIPGIRVDEDRKPWATILLVAIGCLWWLALIPLRNEALNIVFVPLGDWWQVLTAPFMQANGWYQFASLGAVGLFGWLLERRHGPLAVLAIWLLSASGAYAVLKAVDGSVFAMGASPGALGLLCAWVVPVVLARRAGRDDDDADLLGAAAFFVLLALMPLARPEVDPLATAVGIVVGSLCGLVLARVRPR
jgi:membrane associated rhomboid family serine protease